MSSQKDNHYKNVMESDEHLAVFLRAMQQFDAYFCDLMMGKKDFTLKMEVRADGGKVIHCRVYNNIFDRPKDAPKMKEYMDSN